MVHNFTENIDKRIFFDKNVYALIEFSLSCF